MSSMSAFARALLELRVMARQGMAVQNDITESLVKRLSALEDKLSHITVTDE